MLAPDPPPALSSLHTAAEAIVASCKAELARKPAPERAAALHHEIAQAYQGVLGDLAAAQSHYAQALAAAPDRLPSIRAAREVLVALGRFSEALPLFESELKLTADRKDKAQLHMQRGRLLAERMNDEGGARAAYADALELDATNASILKALERCDQQARAWPALDRVYERAADAAREDARYRAALVVRRAELHENQLGDPAGAAELYAFARELDPGASGALEALVRVHSGRGEWHELTAVLDRLADRSEDPAERALTLYRAGRLQAGRLGSRPEAVAALARALASAPGDALVLDELARFYREAGDHEELAAVLRELVDVVSAPEDRRVLLHELGEVYERGLEREDEAIRCYRQALAQGPGVGQLPVLQALGRLLERRQDWAGLCEMHLEEAASGDSSLRRAAAHARAAEVYETRMQRADQAAVQHAKALALVPGYATSWKALTRLYALAGRHRELCELHERAVDEAPSNARKVAHLMKIGALWEDALDDAAQAASAYRRILKLEPEHLGALHALGRVLETSERWDELVDCLEREAALYDARPENRPLVLGLLERGARILDQNLDNAAGAKQRYLKALELDPGYLPALTGLGRLYHRAGRWDDLRDVYRRELEAIGDAGEANARAALLVRMGELDERQRGKPAEAIADYRRASEAVPGHGPAVRALGRLLAEVGDHEQLARLLEAQAASLTDVGERARALYRVGELAEERLDDPKRALDFHRRALREQPDYRPAAAALERLLEAGGAWAELVQQLERAEAATGDPRRKTDLMLRQAAIWRDRLNDESKAIARLQAVLAQPAQPGDEPARLAALLALEPLHARAGDRTALAAVYALQAQLLTDPGAQLAALRELVRLQESDPAGNTEAAEAVARSYQAILALAPGDRAALRALAARARRRGDTAELQLLYAQLAEGEADDGVGAQHWIELGQLLEAAGSASAADAYAAALAKVPGSLAALRGLARLAEASGDAAALVEVTRREAALSLDPQGAAELLVRSATLCLERRGDRLGAIADLEKALELWPDNALVPDLLRTLLTGAGAIDHLVALLSRAAEGARQPARRAALWVLAANVYADAKKDGGAAVAALQRALKLDPYNLEVQRALARVYLGNAQWSEASVALERLVALEADPRRKAETQLELAVILDDKLGQREKAQEALTAALKLVPGDPEILGRLARVQLRLHGVQAAAATIAELRDKATDDSDRARALVLTSLLEAEQGEAPKAQQTLLEAVALEGPSGEAAAAFEQLAAAGTAGAAWAAFAAAVDAYIGRCQRSEDRAAGFAALARVYAERMALPRKAVEVLGEALKLGGEREPELWAALVRTLQASGRPAEARLAAGGLAALGASAAPELELVRAAPPRPGWAAPGSFGPAEIAALSVEQATNGPAAELLVMCADGLGRLAPTDLGDYGLSRKDRMPPGSEHPLREILDRLSGAVGFECDLYEHAGQGPLVTIGLTEPLALIVDARLGALPEGQRVFLMGRALLALALHLHPALLLAAEDLKQALDACAKLVVPAYGDGDPGIEELAHRLRRVIPRRDRRELEMAAMEYAEQPLDDAARWQLALGRTLNRAAAVLADDLGAAMGALALVSDTSRPQARGQLDADEATDLLRFWMSPPAMQLRAQAEMIVPVRARS